MKRGSENVLKALPWPERLVVLKALEFADISAISDVECNFRRLAPGGSTYAPMNGRSEVSTLIEAPLFMRNAVQYLVDRGLASVVNTDGHERVLLSEEPMRRTIRCA